ncbi:MAG: NifU family protein [Suipraeoptans sp.]
MTDIMMTIEDVLNKKVRPNLHMHRGDVEVLRLEDGVLYIKLLGHCSSCPSSKYTVEELIQEELISTIPEIKEVRLHEEISEEMLSFAKKILAERKANKETHHE